MHHIIQELAADNSRLVKEAIILREATAGNEEFFEGCRLALDPLITFGVKKVPKFDGPDGQGLPWVAFKQLADSLAKRELTGHAARDAIELALGASTKAQWNDWYRLILTKDLRCGVSEKTINKCVKGTKIKPIPLFECMLAHDGANYESKLTGKKLLEPKLDGVRVITFVDVKNKTATMYSRNGRVLENFTHITTAIEKNIDQFKSSVILDGEMVSSSFQALMKQVHRKKDVKTDDARLMLFDIIPLAEFNKGQSTFGQKYRSQQLQKMKPIFDLIGSIDIIPQKEVDLDTYVGELEFKQYNKEAVDAGFEGIMVKDVDAEYVKKRTVAWLKIKPFIEVSLTIVGLNAGTGKFEGKVGSLDCEGEEDGKFIKVDVPSFPDEVRDQLNESVIGQVIEVKADAMTKGENSTHYSLRFPRFQRFRGFKAGEKI